MAQEWDLIPNDRLPLPHREWAAWVLSQLELRGDEFLIYAGLGPGREVLPFAERLPHGQLVAIDGSQQAIANEREAVAGQQTGCEIRFLLADLSSPLPIVGEADVIVSIGKFQWIKYHERLFRNMWHALKPGGWLVFDCDGSGSIPNVNDAIQTAEPEVFRRVDAKNWMWEFAKASTTAARLEAAGFVDIDAHRVQAPLRIEDPDVLRKFLKTVILGGYLDSIPRQTRGEFVEKVADAMLEPVIDYVRLQVKARKPE